MKFNPKSSTDVLGLLSKGVYTFEILDATDTSSKAGNDMMVVKLSIDDGARAHKVTDYIVSGIDSIAYKIRHFAEAIGMLAEYEKGELLAENVRGAVGQCKVDIEPEGAYPAKNIVRDYVPAKKGAEVDPVPVKKAPVGRNNMDDDIPF